MALGIVSNRAPRRWRAFFVTALALWQLLGGAEATAATKVRSAKAPPLDCSTALEKLQDEIGPAVGDDHWTPKSIYPTVRELGSRAGSHGGRVVTLFRTGTRWASHHSTVSGYDPQGDPRWFVGMVGEEAARFFGFRIVDDERVEVPDQAEFIGALEAINSVLRLSGDEIPITFYTTVDNANVKAAEYVRRFRDQAGIPLAHSGNHLIHDLSFHTAAIFLPPEAVRLKRLEAKFLEAFIKYVTPKYAHDPALARALRFYALSMRLERTASIDRGTGLLAPLLVIFLQTRDEERWKRDVTFPLQNMTSHGKSPAQMVEFLLETLSESKGKVRAVFGSLVDYDKLDRYYEVLKPRDLLVHLRTFERIFDPDARMPAQWARMRADTVVDRLCLEITKRRKLIRDIALQLLPSLGEPPSPIPAPSPEISMSIEEMFINMTVEYAKPLRPLDGGPPSTPPPPTLVDRASWWQRLKARVWPRKF